MDARCACEASLRCSYGGVHDAFCQPEHSDASLRRQTHQRVHRVS